MPEWNDFIDWMIKGILGSIGIYGVHVLSQMKVSIDALNEKMARLIERTEWHTKEIEKLEDRVVRLENQKRLSNGKHDFS